MSAMSIFHLMLVLPKGFFRLAFLPQSMFSSGRDDCLRALHHLIKNSERAKFLDMLVESIDTIPDSVELMFKKLAATFKSQDPTK